MRFYTNGIPMKKFVEAKDYLEASFFAIDDISPDSNNPHIVVIRYSSKSLPSIVEFSRTPTFAEGRFPIGLGRVGWIVTSFTEVPHMLVGGGTGKGKSSFLRFIITYFLTRMRDVEVLHVDLKRGAEASVFNGCKNYRSTFEVKKALEFLTDLEQRIRERMELLAENKLLSIEDFIKQPNEKIKWTRKITSRQQLNRFVLVIDEASSLFMSGPNNTSADSIKARGLAQIIGAKGRAAGIHLIVATQRPDLRSVDTNLKTHLTGRLALHMSDIASSTTILDSARATKMTAIQGRAIWKESSVLAEVQLPFISAEDTRKCLENSKMIDTSRVSQEATLGTQVNNAVPDTEEDSAEFLSIIDKNKEQSLSDGEVSDA
jgi:S-DNA-T family DNA segregation ATPase FtsK/SpoIIIE